ncbi:MAG TPA: ABC transporter ATP-binding protein [Burkholderiales bacterium]
MSVVRATNLTKTYRSGDVEVQAVRGVDFVIEPGSFVAFVGPSGSGKSTLLNMVGCLDHPTSGKLSVLDTDVATLDRHGAANFRGTHLGFIFQDFNLIPVLSAAENIEYPLLMVQDWPAEKRQARVAELLDAVGMADQAGKRPDQLSGGQKQRVAVARALATRAKLVLADEPTANLDSETGRTIIELMRSLRRQQHTTFVFSTHDAAVMAKSDRVIELRDGVIAADEVRQETASQQGARPHAAGHPEPAPGARNGRI